jgi:lipoic acid synthetase
MVGLGETWGELLATMDDLRSVDCDILTLGQYLQPSRYHVPIARYYTPDEFVGLRAEGEARGFAWIEAGPLVRSSYHAERQATVLRSQ